jgi:hypothetical protein
MNRDDIEDWPAPFMAQASYRALHSWWVDALFEATRELRHAVIEVAGGMSFGHFILAIEARKYRVQVQIEEEVPWLWLSYWDGEQYRPIIATTPDVLGADPAAILREQRWRMEAAIEDIVGEDA